MNIRWLCLAAASALLLTACAHAGGGQREASQCSSRAIVLSFYNEALIAQHPRAAFARYVSPAFIEHKPDVPGGTREATAAFLEELIAGMPAPRWEIVRTIAEGDMVAVHARFRPAPEAPAYAIADFFRVENCLIAEHWDVVAGPPAQSENPNDRF